ncbi:hypothetical protein OG758_23695 [Streptomyces sp. NBC_01474]|nr:MULTISPECIES: hypothetical protein [unclassified Streptomyces]WSE01940.1 hypothetical protein OG758_23695 [Streptomyces sp. NBC_01474]
MDPAVLGTRLASSVLPPLVKQLLTRDGPGAGQVDKPVRLSGLVTFHGEKRTLGLTCLSRVTSLSSLSVIQPVPGDSLAALLPVGAPLDQLILGRGATEATGLNGLGALPELTWPNLSSDTAALGPRDWEQLARHPALTRLSLGGRLLPPHGLSSELPGIRVLTLRLEAGTEEHVCCFAPAVPYADEVRLHFAEDAAPAADAIYAGLFPQAEVTVHRRGR